MAKVDPFVGLPEPDDSPENIARLRRGEFDFHPAILTQGTPLPRPLDGKGYPSADELDGD